ncbi:hypothetical protein [Persicobacter diffluens]|uniref:Uncharacterized protein n=1 Tax=Persicobacter diffluens TaxID=981 RepID=A0AAN4W5F7_9BACT|nr:hypothetical protein PEDI_55200 [Persicobacter diffluens]
MSRLRLPFGLYIGSGSSTDSRQIVANLRERLALVDNNRAFKGMIVYQEDTDKHYTLKGTTNDRWVEIPLKYDSSGRINSATDSEVDAGNIDYKYLSPKGLKSWWEKVKSSLGGNSQIPFELALLNLRVDRWVSGGTNDSFQVRLCRPYYNDIWDQIPDALVFRVLRYSDRIECAGYSFQTDTDTALYKTPTNTGQASAASFVIYDKVNQVAYLNPHSYQSMDDLHFDGLAQNFKIIKDEASRLVVMDADYNGEFISYKAAINSWLASYALPTIP